MKKTSYLLGTPNWVHLGTTDADKSCAFYGRLFGWSYETPNPAMGGCINATKAGERVAGIMPSPRGAPTYWGTFFASGDATADAKKIEDAGGKIIQPPHPAAEEGTMAVAVDPTGAAFGLWQPGRHSGSGLFGESGAMVWHELMTGDVEKALTFYKEILGVTTNEIEPGYHLLEKGGLGHGAITDLKGGISGKPEWVVYFAVDDAEATATTIKQLGGTVSSAPRTTPYGVMGFAEDTLGARFAFMQPTPPT